MKNLRVLVTSRTSMPAASRLRVVPRGLYRELSLDKVPRAATDHDIEILIKYRLRELKAESETLNRHCFSRDVVRVLLQEADGNFNNAAKSCRTIESFERQLPGVIELPDLAPTPINIGGRRAPSFEPRPTPGQGLFGDVIDVGKRPPRPSYLRRQRPLPTGRSREAIDNGVMNTVQNSGMTSHQQVTILPRDFQRESHFSTLVPPVAQRALRLLWTHCESEGFDTESFGQIGFWFGGLLDSVGNAHQRKLEDHNIRPSDIMVEESHSNLLGLGGIRNLPWERTSNELMLGIPSYSAAKTRLLAQKKGRIHARALDLWSLGCGISEVAVFITEGSLRHPITA